MRNTVAIIILLFAVVTESRSQYKDFVLSGKVNQDTGTVLLLPNGGKDYEISKKKSHETRLINGRFVFIGKLIYPSSYRLLVGPKYVSDYFIITPGNQEIIINVDSIREVPKISNYMYKSYTEYISKFHVKYERDLDILYSTYVHRKSLVKERPALDSIRLEFIKSRNEINNAHDRELITYAKVNPNSYIILWDLVRWLSDGYKPIYDTIFLNLSFKVRNTSTGLMLKKRLNLLKKIAVGQILPPLILSDTARKRIVFDLYRTRNQSKYTLIDFWFSRCKPCLEQFPEYKKIYNSHYNKGFNIVNISTDRKQDFDYWIKTIKTNELYWNNYLDMDGLVSRELSINSFPTNFLLDNSGRILRRDIRPNELELFLVNADK